MKIDPLNPMNRMLDGEAPHAAEAGEDKEASDDKFEYWWKVGDYDKMGFATSKGVARSAWHFAIAYASRPIAPGGQNAAWKPVKDVPLPDFDSLAAPRGWPDGVVPAPAEVAEGAEEPTPPEPAIPSK